MNKSLRDILNDVFAEAFINAGYERKFGLVVDSFRPELGQFQCNGALEAAKIYKKSPLTIAEDILLQVREQTMFSEVSIAGPGFINISITDIYLSDFVEKINHDKKLGYPTVTEPEKIILDFGGPNIAKPMHVGHLRSMIIGDCLQKLYKFVGHDVISDIHIGDWGLQMGMVISEIKKKNPNLPYFDSSDSMDYPNELPIEADDLEAIYPSAATRCREDKRAMDDARKATLDLQSRRKGYIVLWKQIRQLSESVLKNDLDELGIKFDLWLGESHYNPRIPALINKAKKMHVAKQSEGALIIEVDSNKPPLILLKSDGAFLYSTTDLATIEERVEKFKPDRILYVVDQRQHLHFEQVFLAAKELGITNNVNLCHIGFGTVNGPDGKPFKTRAGGVLKLKDLINMVQQKALQRMKESRIASNYNHQEQKKISKKVGIAALKFSDLINNRKSDYLFDIDRFTSFEGKTGPYVLYTGVRIKSILRKGKEKKCLSGEIVPPILPIERDLMLKLCKMPDAINIAIEKNAPHYLSEFTYDLSQLFSQFYKQCHILSESDTHRRGSWLSLSKTCLLQLEEMLGLLGIEIPEYM